MDEREYRAMNARKNSYEPTASAVKTAPRIKTVRLQIGVADLHLKATIKAAFDLAKSAGRELDLTFGPGQSSQTALSQLRVE